MEPFGLFHFLQSLLSQNPAPPATPPESEKNAETKIPSCAEAPKENACALFLEEHEKRASRIKK